MPRHYPSRSELSALAVSLCLSVPVMASQAPDSRAVTPAVTWIRSFAEPGPISKTKALGNGNSLLWDPRFTALLKTSFPQKQWFWYDHYRLTPTADVVQSFLGNTGNAILDHNRYVTVNGCVPHVCDALFGMLWVDTGDHPELLFIATNPAGSNSGDETYHLWLFTSTKLDWTHLPAPFLASLQRWIDNIDTNNLPMHFALATIVQPNGVMEDITPDVLHLSTHASGVKQ